jgi:hypothetical protein
MGADRDLARFGERIRGQATPVLLALLVVAFACGSGSISSVKSAGLHLRWLALAAGIIAVAVAAWNRWSHEERRPGNALIRFFSWSLAFLGIAFLSTGWSVAVKLTFERAVSLAALFVLAALAAYAAEGKHEMRRSMLTALAVGAVSVAILGIIVLIFDKSAAVQQASSVTPWRFRGFTENPNTISVLAAVALPIVGWLLFSAKFFRTRCVWFVSGALLLGSIVAAESRGGLVAGIAGVATVCAVQVRPMRRLVVALATLAVILVGGIELRVVTDPGQAPFVSIQPPAPKGHLHVGTTKLIHLQTRTFELPGAESEIGNPLLSRTASSVVGSGRVSEWKGVLKQVEERPLVGYGFGTEERVFVDRWYYFQGGTAENSYLGLLLQMGIVGASLLCGMGVVLLFASIRTLRRMRVSDRGAVGAELGVLVAGACLMAIQSYIYSVGNVATATVWIALFFLGGDVLYRRRDAILG